MKGRLPSVLLASFLFIGLFLRVEQAIRNPRMVHPDEIFQTEEPAHRLAYGYGVITWEWRLGVRSWVFPAILACVMRATSWLGAGSAGYLLGISILLALVSLTTIWFGFAWANRTGGMVAAIIAAGACATWYELVIFAPRALSETVAAHLLLPGLYLGVYGKQLSERRRLFLAGILCGVSLSLRIQLAPAITFAALYICWADWRKRFIPVIVGLGLPIVVFGFVDMLTWSYPLQSFVRYCWVNVVARRSELYGTEPWYWYLELLIYHWGPMAFLAAVGVRRSVFLGWLALIILASHSVVGHKEVRFLYPLVPIMVTLASLGIVEIAAVFLAMWEHVAWAGSAVGAIGLALCCLASSLLAPRFSFWPSPDSVAVFDRLSRDSTICGVGIYTVPWFVTGGYAHLHRRVPIILVREDSSIDKQSEEFNVLVTNGVLAKRAASFQIVECLNKVCFYKRDGSCIVHSQGQEVNEVLRRTGD